METIYDNDITYRFSLHIPMITAIDSCFLDKCLRINFISLIILIHILIKQEVKSGEASKPITVKQGKILGKFTLIFFDMIIIVTRKFEKYLRF